MMGMYAAPTNKGEEIAKIVEVMKDSGIVVTEDIIMSLTKVVYNYVDNTPLFDTLMPVLNTVLGNITNTDETEEEKDA